MSGEALYRVMEDDVKVYTIYMCELAIPHLMLPLSNA